MDRHTRESLAIEAGFGGKGRQAVEVLRQPVAERGVPKAIRCDNGPEFVSRALDQRAHWSKDDLDFNRPGRPTDNAFLKALDSRFRQECLDTTWFFSLADGRERIEARRRDYNEHRPHNPLGNQSPNELFSTHRALRAQPAGRAVQRLVQKYRNEDRSTSVMAPTRTGEVAG